MTELRGGVGELRTFQCAGQGRQFGFLTVSVAAFLRRHRGCCYTSGQETY